MKPAKPLPLGDFSELVFEGQFFFLNEQYQERATDACFNAHFYVCAPSAETPPDHYRLVARRPCDEQCVSVSALTGEYHLEFVCCATLSGARQTLCYTTGVIRATDIGSARTKTVREGGVSLLQAEVEVMGEMEAGEATYPLRPLARAPAARLLRAPGRTVAATRRVPRLVPPRRARAAAGRGGHHRVRDAPLDKLHCFLYPLFFLCACWQKSTGGEYI